MRSAPPPVSAELLGASFHFTTAPGLFSADRIDDGTRLLLDHLPERPPSSVLDLGCGYGALGLPVAARHPSANCTLVDRDTLAVEAARKNAEGHGLRNVEAKPSLGYRDLGDARFDWVLCNVPARIGDAAIEYILLEGAKRLLPGGELRVVVIRDLSMTVEEIAARRGVALSQAAVGARHAVYALGPVPGPLSSEHEAFYGRDRVELEGLSFERPHDIGEDEHHLREGLPLLLELLPKAPAGRALIWRGGYGVAATLLAKRGANVTAADRDLIGTTFTRRNAAAHGVEVQTRDGFALERVLDPKPRLSFFAGELHPTTGEEAAWEDFLASSRAVKPGSLALWLGLTSQGRPWLERLSKKKKAGFSQLAARGPYSVWRVTAPPEKR